MTFIGLNTIIGMLRNESIKSFLEHIEKEFEKVQKDKAEIKLSTHKKTEDYTEYKIEAIDNSDGKTIFAFFIKDSLTEVIYYFERFKVNHQVFKEFMEFTHQCFPNSKFVNLGDDIDA